MNNTFWISLGVALVFLFLLNYYLMGSKKKSAGGAGSWTVYGTNGCGWTRKQLKEMDDKGIDYTFVDCDEDGKQCTGMSGLPTLKDDSGNVSTGYKSF